MTDIGPASGLRPGPSGPCRARWSASHTPPLPAHIDGGEPRALLDEVEPVGLDLLAFRREKQRVFRFRHVAALGRAV